MRISKLLIKTFLACVPFFMLLIVAGVKTAKSYAWTVPAICEVGTAAGNATCTDGGSSGVGIGRCDIFLAEHPSELDWCNDGIGTCVEFSGATGCDCDCGDPNQPIDCITSDGCIGTDVCIEGQCVPNIFDCTVNPDMCYLDCPNHGAECLPDGTCSTTCYPDCDPNDPPADECPACTGDEVRQCTSDGTCTCVTNPLCTEQACATDCGPGYTGYCLADPLTDPTTECPFPPASGFCTTWCACVLGAPVDPPVPGPGDYTGPLISFTNLLTALQNILIPVGIAVFGLPLIVINSYKLMTSQGDPAKVKDAREGLTSAIMGIVFVLLSLTLLRLMIVSLFGIDI